MRFTQIGLVPRRAYRTPVGPGGVFVSSTTRHGDRIKFIKFVGPIGRFIGFYPLVCVFSTAELVKSRP